MISLGHSMWAKHSRNAVEYCSSDKFFFLFSPVLYNEDPDCQFFAWEFAEFSHLQQVSWFNVTDVCPDAFAFEIVQLSL